MGRIDRKSLDRPDDVRRLPLMTLQVTRVGQLTIGRGTVEPGFRWSTHARPATDTDSCQVHHLQMLLSGRFAVQMDDGEYMEIEPNDVFDVPPGHDAWVLGDEPAVLIDFLGNIDDLGLHRDRDRVVTTLLMTDIVGSTATASRLGDAAWKQLLADHNRVLRGRLDAFRGKEVNTTGDGFLAMFASALSAVRCAAAITEATNAIGIDVRAGVHTGEVEIVRQDVAGVAVHACARVMSLGGPSEVLVSGMTRQLVEGSELDFIDHGSHELKGLERPLQVFRLLGTRS